MTENTSLEEELRLSEARRREIEEEVKKSPLTAALQPIGCLEAQYQDAPTFLQGIQVLTQDYERVRTVRGDGNCYYRAFLYRLAESILHNEQPAEGQRLLNMCKTDSWERVQAAGYQPMTIEMFYEELVELVENLLANKLDAAALHEALNQENATSDYCTWYLRVVTATHLKSDPDRFLPFLDGMDIPTFCQRHVEPMGKECEQVQVLALAEAFGVQVQIEYLDGHDLVNGKLSCHKFGPEDSKTKLVFLYRPGHYDILYPKQTS